MTDLTRPLWGIVAVVVVLIVAANLGAAIVGWVIMRWEARRARKRQRTCACDLFHGGVCTRQDWCVKL